MANDDVLAPLDPILAEADTKTTPWMTLTDDGRQGERAFRPDYDLAFSAPRFFSDLLKTVTDNAPADLHREIRLRRQSEPSDDRM